MVRCSWSVGEKGLGQFWILDFGLPSRLRRLLVAFCLLVAAYCLLLTAYCLLPTAYCLLSSLLAAASAARVEPVVMLRDSLGMLVTKGSMSQPNPLGMSRVREHDGVRDLDTLVTIEA